MVPWKAERQASMLCGVFVALLFSLHGFCIQKWMCQQQRNKDGYLFPESSMHGSYVNMFLVTLTLLLRQFFLR